MTLTAGADLDIVVLRELLADEAVLDIDQWSTVDSFEKLREVKKRYCEFSGKGGIYALIDSEGNIAYIGKAKCLHNRLSSHSKALIGGDELKAPAWDQFFRYFEDKGLQARYLVLDQFGPENSELGRRAIESALQMIHRPYFDLIYNERNGRVINFEERLVEAKIKQRR